MSEKDPAAELKDIVLAWTFADVARVVGESSRPGQASPSFTWATEAFEALPGLVRKRLAKLNVVDSAALVIQLADRATRRVR